MDRTKLIGFCVLASSLMLSGCVARTYELTRERVDQDLSNLSGNRGYIMGTAPQPGDRKMTRQTRVFEIELGPTDKTKTPCPAATPLATQQYSEPAPVNEIMEEAPAEDLQTDFEKYRVVKNDTLQKISKKFYGTTKKWMKIYEANKDVLSGPDKLYPGQVLKIPGGQKITLQEPAENLK